MAEIPTMECPECAGSGDGDEADEHRGCHFCDSAGRIPRPPLTPEQIAALPDACGCCGCSDVRSGLARCPRGHGELTRLVIAGRLFDDDQEVGAWEAYKLRGLGVSMIVPKHWGTAAARRLDDLSDPRVWLADDGGDQA